jgi:hypothetical protein
VLQHLVKRAMSTEEEQRGLLGEPAQGASAPPPQEVPVPVPAADVAAEFESNSGHTMVIRSSPGPAPAQDWAQSCDRGELGKHVDALYSFLVCGANDGGESSSGGVFLVAKGAALPPSSGKQENVGRVVYRVPGAPADDAGTPPAVRLMNVRGLSRCGLEAVMATLGQLRAARVKAGGASAGEAATMDPAAMMAAWMAAQAAGGGKKERNAVVEALCCIVSPIYEFVAEFAGASVWQPIKDCCRSKDKAAAAAPATAPKPSEAGVLDLLVAVRPAAPEQEEELTIFVRAKDAAAMAEFVALWTETLLPAAVAAQDVGAAGPVVEALEGAEVQAQPPTVDRFERPYIDAVRALTKYAKPCEKALIFLATAGLGFNAGAVSQVASITSRIVVLVLSEDYDAAQDKAWEIFMWGAIFASIQLSAYFILERSAEVLSARFRRHYFKAMLRQDQEWFDVQPTSLTTDLTQDVNMVRVSDSPTHVSSLTSVRTSPPPHVSTGWNRSHARHVYQHAVHVSDRAHARLYPRPEAGGGAVPGRAFHVESRQDDARGLHEGFHLLQDCVRTGCGLRRGNLEQHGDSDIDRRRTAGTGHVCEQAGWSV